MSDLNPMKDNLAAQGDILISRLHQLAVASCTCMTKSPDSRLHSTDCDYRCATEALDATYNLLAGISDSEADKYAPHEAPDEIAGIERPLKSSAIPYESPTGTEIKALTARLAEVEADRSALLEYAKDATAAITGLTAGGSEYFGKPIAGVYTADLAFCVDRIRGSKEALLGQLSKAVKDRKGLEANPVAGNEGGLREALHFYADAWLKKSDGGELFEPNDALWDDRGALARAALSQPALKHEIGIKPLDWFDRGPFPAVADGHGTGPAWSQAYPDYGRIDIYSYDGGKTFTDGNSITNAPHATLDAAKAAAQAQYEARIRARLIDAKAY